MKTKFSIIIITLILLFSEKKLFAGTFTSQSSGNWNDNTVTTPWTFVGDADGIPDADDDVTILTGHIIAIPVTSASNSLTLQGTGAINFTAIVTLTVNGILTVNGAGSVTGSVIGTLNLPGGLSIISAANLSLGAINVTVGGATSISGTLTFSSTLGTKSFSGTITVNAGGTWDASVGNSVTVNCSIVNNGAWYSGGASAYTVNSGSTYAYSGTGQIVMGILNLNGSRITNSGTLVLTNSTVGNGLALTGGAVFNNVGYLSLSGSGSSNINVGVGSSLDFTVVGNTVDYSYSGIVQAVYSTTYYNIICSAGTKSTSGTGIVVTNLLTLSNTTTLDVVFGTTITGTGSIKMTETSVLKFSASGTYPSVTGGANSFGPATSITLNNGTPSILSSSGTGPGQFPYQNINVTNAAVSFINVTNVAGNVNVTTSNITSNAVLTIGGTLTYTSGTATTLTNNVTLGNLVLNAPTASGLILGTNNLTFGSDNAVLDYRGGTISASSGQVIFTTGLTQTITQTAPIVGTTVPTFKNLTIDNTNGVTFYNNDITVTTNLSLVNGTLTTGTNKVIMNSGSTVTRTNGYVNGNLQRAISTGAVSVTFDIGSGGLYAPVAFVFTNVSAAGALTLSTTASAHPNTSASGVDPTKVVNRYWTVANTTLTFSGTYSATFNFSVSEYTATFSNFTARRYTGTNWNAPAGAITSTSTSFKSNVETVASGSLPTTTSSDWVVGEPIPITTIYNRVIGTNNWSNKATWIQYRSGTIALTAGLASVVGAGTKFLTELTTTPSGDVIMLTTAPGTAYTILSITDDTHLTLTANAGATVGGSYGRQVVPNSNVDDVTIGNSSIASDNVTDIQLDMNASIFQLTINPLTDGKNYSLMHLGTNSLTTATNVNVANTKSSTAAWNINGGSASVNGNVVIGNVSSISTKISKVVITSGTLTIKQNLLFNTSNGGSNELAAQLDMSGGAGTLNLAGSMSFAIDYGLLLPGTSSSFNFNGTSAQVIGVPSSNTTSWKFNNLYLSNTSTAGVSLGLLGPYGYSPYLINSANVMGDIIVQSGIFFMTHTSVNLLGNTIAGNAGKTFQVAAGATFVMNGTGAFPTGFGTFDLGTAGPSFGTVVYQHTGASSVSQQAYGNLQFNSAQLFTLPVATLAVPTSVAGNLIVGGGATLQGNSTSTFSYMKIIGDVTINNSPTSTLNANKITNLSVGGNWTNNGIFTPSTNTVTFIGGITQPQAIGGTTTNSFNNLTLNTTSATNTVKLLSSISLSTTGILTLTKGGLSLNGNTLNINNSTPSATGTGAITRKGIDLGGTDVGYIKSETYPSYSPVAWKMAGVIGTYLFPFGIDNTNYIPFVFNSTGAGVGASGVISVATYHTGNDNMPLPSGVGNILGGVSPATYDNSPYTVDRFWMITPSGYSPNPTATLTLTATSGASSEIGTITSLQAQRWNTGAGYWDAPIAGQSTTANSVTVSAGQNIATSWAISGNGRSLPVELLWLKGYLAAGKVSLYWKTASELNNDFFAIERSSDGIHFIELGKVKGSGTTDFESSYLFYDEFPNSGNAYYRLHQFDFDKHESFSYVVQIKNTSSVQFFPNPSDGNTLYIRLPENYSEELIVTVLDNQGRQVYSEQFNDTSTSYIEVHFSNRLQSGLYMAVIKTQEQVYRSKIEVK